MIYAIYRLNLLCYIRASSAKQALKIARAHYDGDMTATEVSSKQYAAACARAGFIVEYHQ